MRETDPGDRPEGGSSKARKRKKPRTQVSGPWLERVALAHLQRFSSSRENLRRVLSRRVSKVARAAAYAAEQDEPGTGEAIKEERLAAGAEIIEPLLDRFVEAGLLNDRVYAEGRVRALHRQGHPARAIRARLRAKGVPAELVDEVLELLAEEDDGGLSPDLEAAILRARRKRLGPYRDEASRADRRQRDLGALARAGFSFDVARQVIDAPDKEHLEDMLYGAGR
ncbi:MAG: regulatory protein RecX [Bradymonadia bacterium]